MNIHIAEHYGMCFGVRDAIAKAENLAAEGPLTILGELVHNPVVRERLATRGVLEAPLNEVGIAPTAQVMITAHGASDHARESWRAAGFGVADGTCPLVRHAHHQLAVLVHEGHAPVVIGRPGHVEVQGLIEDFPGAVVIETEADFSKLRDASSYGVISQTTQPIDHVEALVDAMRLHLPGKKVIFRDTVCQPTKNRQAALKRLIDVCDTVVVIGGSNSNNTLALVRAVRAAGRNAVHVTRPEELSERMFVDARNVGVTAGTSTLRETVTAVVAKLEALGGKRVEGELQTTR